MVWDKVDLNLLAVIWTLWNPHRWISHFTPQGVWNPRENETFTLHDSNSGNLGSKFKCTENLFSLLSTWLARSQGGIIKVKTTLKKKPFPLFFRWVLQDFFFTHFTSHSSDWIDPEAVHSVGLPLSGTQRLGSSPLMSSSRSSCRNYRS